MTNQAKGLVAAFLMLLGLVGLTFCDAASADDQRGGVVKIVDPPELVGYELYFCGRLIGVILPEATQHLIGAEWAPLDEMLFDWSVDRGGHTVIIHLDKMMANRYYCPLQS